MNIFWKILRVEVFIAAYIITPLVVAIHVLGIWKGRLSVMDAAIHLIAWALSFLALLWLDHNSPCGPTSKPSSTDVAKKSRLSGTIYLLPAPPEYKDEASQLDHDCF